MGRKGKGGKKKKRNNRNNHKNGHQRGGTSQKESILSTLQQVQDMTKDELHHANGHRGGESGKKRKNKQHQKGNKKRPRGKSELNQFLDQLCPLGLGIRNADGDGNCLFRAIADQISGDQRNNGRFRKDIVHYMKQNSEEFAPF